MSVKMPETKEGGVLREMFYVAYANAEKLVLEQNDIEAAIDCLSLVKPESKSSLWRWTDLMAALLLRKGDYSGCWRVLASYDSNYPGDPRIVSLVQMLRKKSLGIGLPDPIRLGGE
jgi:hypothetical protein